MKPGTRSLVADLADAGAPADVRRDAGAGDFDPIEGDPLALRARWPGVIAEAAAVRAYDVREAVPLARPAVEPRRFIERPPTSVQLTIMAALRRLVDRGDTATVATLAREASIKLSLMPDHLAGMEARGLVELMPVPNRQPLVVLGPRAAGYQDRDMRTERSKQIEALLRAGRSVAEIVATDEIKPRPTKAEVYRCRSSYCDEIELTKAKRAPSATGDNHRAVVERIKAGATDIGAIARALVISRARVHQIIANARRRGELPEAP